jgi:hypothetical protein
VTKVTGKFTQIAGKNRQIPSGEPYLFHRLLTVADAKIPLSVVQVKREPPYVVF